ncbi:hypothetical protein SDC9_60605 [bioreactor metagenome]|uniref:Chromate transport protein n=1 Tax=bioreactor metagenome TaxID=1076179 RepID=A0A644XJI8_9ZZZZ
MNLYVDLFLTFAKVGVCTFGGGIAMLPILQRELVEDKGWATNEELTDYYAVGQCTPGIIAVNTATFIGFRKAGNWGGILATLGVVFPSVVIISLIAAFLRQFSDIPAVAHAFAGIRACVCALVLISILKLLKSSVVDITSAIVFSLVLILAAGVGLSPVLLVIVAGVCGLSIRRMRGWQK